MNFEHLLTLLVQGSSEEEIARYLRKEIDEHFGLSPENYDLTEVARWVRKWFDHGWRSAGEPVTIFVALLDEGVDVWRPVQARPLDRGHFRIIGRGSRHKRRDVAVSCASDREVREQAVRGRHKRNDRCGAGRWAGS